MLTGPWLEFIGRAAMPATPKFYRARVRCSTAVNACLPYVRQDTVNYL